jgi:uncharacterized damage-inducible protein DinB
MLQAHFRMFALYTRWANNRLYAAAAKLPEAALREDRGAFFKSVLGTLNHLLVTDQIWMSRLEGNSPIGYRLDAQPHDALPALAAARAAENQRIITYVHGLAEPDFATVLNYTTNAGAVAQPVGHLLMHLFNHHAHHRGQVHGLLSQIAGPEAAPSLDLVAYQRLFARDDVP